MIAGLASAVLAAPTATRAAPRPGMAPATILVVGVGPANLAPRGLRHGMAELGYVEGRDFSMPFYTGELVELMPELERRHVDVIFAVASGAVAAARRATRTVPVVAVDLETEPVAEGLIKSFARPGGNLTGLFVEQSALAEKWLELLGEVIPGMARLAVLRDPDLGSGPWWAIESAAKSRKLQLHGFALNVSRLERVFADIEDFTPNALVLLSSPLVVERRAALAALALKAVLPSITLFRVYAEAGGLMTYGPDPFALGKQAAGHVDRILNGARPADLPIHQPTKFELVVNQKTADALDIAIPPTLLARADKVIR